MESGVANSEASGEAVSSAKMDNFSFRSFCQLLNKLERTSGPKRKIDSIFTKEFRAVQRAESVFPFLRLLLPAIDRERVRAEIREARLCTLLTAALGWGKENPAAVRLKKWKDPTAVNELSRASGDFPVVMRDVLRAKQVTRGTGAATLKDVNEVLDQLGRCSNDSERKAVFASLVATYSADELYWLARILLRDMKIGLSETSVLHRLHPDAQAAFNTHSDLRLICETMRDPAIRFAEEIKMFGIFEPMKAEKYHEVVNPTKEMKEIAVEEKLDGHRMLVHYDRTLDKVVVVSRNKKEHTERYSELLLPNLRECVKADKVILDGELMAFDGETGTFVFLQELNTIAGECRKYIKRGQSPKQNKRWLCYVVFDLLYLSDPGCPEKSLLGHPLKTRRKHLTRVLKEVPHELEIAKQQTIISLNKRADHVVLMKALEEAIVRRAEGLMIKDCDAPYTLGRCASWLKLKPEYFQSLRDTLDVIVLGGYYGKGARMEKKKGDLGSVLCCVSKPFAEGEKPDSFYAFCKVGNFKDTEVDHLHRMLKDKWIPFDENYSMRYLNGWKPAKRDDVPDVVLKPEDGFIATVNGSQLTPSAGFFNSNYTLRFPKAKKVIREDKNWYESMTMDDLHKMVQSDTGLFKTGVHVSPVSRKRNRNRSSSSPGSRVVKGKLAPQFEPTVLSNVERKSAIFRGKGFYVVPFQLAEPFTGLSNLPYGNNHDINTVLHANGARKTLSMFVKSVDYVIGHEGSLNNVTMKNLIDLDGHDILLPDWIDSCLQAGKILSPAFSHYIHMCSSTREELKEKLDEFGDHYTEPANKHTLRQSLSIARKKILREVQRGTRKSASTSPEERQELLDDIEDPLFTPNNCLRGTCIYFDLYENLRTVANDPEIKTYSKLRATACRAALYGARRSSEVRIVSSSHGFVLAMLTVEA